ncbi:SpoIID/LytB domain-containing protein [candidate division KSB1 bacterium]|nr:SpoIID/LytB domain-containing protein [candidate division KSB1 bacterium]
MPERFCTLKRSVTARIIFYTAFFMASMLFFSCSSSYFQPRPPLSPIIRIGIVLDAEEIKFQPDKKMIITPKEGEDRYRSEQTDIWTIRVNEGSVTPSPCRLLLAEFAKKADAKKSAKEFGLKGIETKIAQEGDELWYGGKLISGSSVHRVYAAQKFATEEQATAAQRANAALAGARVVRGDAPLTGDLVLISPKGDELAIKDAMRLSGTEFTIHEVKVGEGYHWSRTEKRTYRGELEIRVNKNGNLVAINVLPLEDYLQGVLPGEMSALFPLEALKAQAIAARTFFLYNFNRVHIDDPFDACADVHCQVYVGSGKSNDKIDKAIRETRGLVLQYNEELCSTPFSAMCGGHTEHSGNVWSGETLPYLTGVFDLDHPEQFETRFDLSQEVNARKWIESLPDVHCNVEKAGSPDYAGYAKKFFRWENRFTRQELEQNIKNYTGVDFGSLLDLKPISRGVSGRIIELAVTGTSNTFSIDKELRIRKALSPTTLYSACIVFDKVGESAGMPEAFIIKGAGWGHGVGMCQIGAAIMADKGKNAGDILKHYYANTTIRQLY